MALHSEAGSVDDEVIGKDTREVKEECSNNSGSSKEVIKKTHEIASHEARDHQGF